MQVRLSRDFLRQVHNSSATGRVLAQAGAPIAARVAAETPSDTGETRASTRVEAGHRSANGQSVAARVVQGGAAVPQQFGNARERTPARQFDRARG